MWKAMVYGFFKNENRYISDFLGNYHLQKKIFSTKNVYFDKVYNFYLKYFFTYT